MKSKASFRSWADRTRWFLILAGLLGEGLTLRATEELTELRRDPEQIFVFQIHTMLVNKCFACHGDAPQELEGELDLTSRLGMLQGGTSGESSLSPGRPGESPLYLAAMRDHDLWQAMPPKESERLTQEELEFLQVWITRGAPWPDPERFKQLQQGRNPWSSGQEVRVQTSGGLSEEWTNRTYEPARLWAYQPLMSLELPAGTDNPIDYFIQNRVPAGLAVAGPAERAILMRRLCYTLTGLPPSPEELAAFVVDRSQNSYELLVDRLLASARYGEHWAKHWLDVVRYADSSGFANDFERPNAWRYRDYVIRSFNNDKPYDQFVQEQLAADELFSESTDAMLGLGFLRMGPWEHTSMAVGRITRQQFLDDVTSSVGQVFLGQALQCARCHDHKFDPVPTQDYYAIQSVFATTQLAELEVPFLPQENRSQFEEDQKYLEQRESALDDLKQTINRPQQTPNDFGRDRLSRKWSTLYRRARDRYQPFALGVYNGHTNFGRTSHKRFEKPANLTNGILEKTAILTGGDVFSPGQVVSPGALSVTAVETEIPPTLDGRRSAFAHWVTNPRNPLTARVMVNRIWGYHFGRGLAGNPNNFGAAGGKPTHPELLDWLAVEFIRSGWSIKKLHKIILMTAAYQRSSTHPHPEQLDALDLDRKSYAVFKMRRLTAEEIRDSMLQVSGELVHELGGLPSRPDMNLEVALQPRMIMGTFAPSYVPNITASQRNRRSVYALKMRGLRDPLMTTFNQPSPDESCEMREASNVTPQVFALFNSEESAERALAFANRVSAETAGDDAAIQRAFELAFGRGPTEDETQAALLHWRRSLEMQEQIVPQPADYPFEVVRQANEENTGELFTFTEPLLEYQDYQPDLQPYEVDVRTRALADLCLVLLNANEFIYID